MRSFETPVNCEIWLDGGDCVLAHWLHAPCHDSRECLFHRVVNSSSKEQFCVDDVVTVTLNCATVQALTASCVTVRAV